MAEVKLAFGFDTERPYGALAETLEGKELLESQLAFLARLIEVFDRQQIPRTFFILGDWLSRCGSEVKGILNKGNLLNDLQQHSFSHQVLRKIAESDKLPVSPEEFVHDVERANKIVKEVLGVRPSGLRVPYGYDRDLSDMPEVLGGLRRLGFKFVSSDLRATSSLEAPLTVARQPYRYAQSGFPDLLEIPSHGWQDVIWTQEKAELFGVKLWGPEEIASYWEEMFSRAKKLSREKSPFYVCLCLHPWAVAEYDPRVEILEGLIMRARSRNIEIVSYSQIAEEVLAT